MNSSAFFFMRKNTIIATVSCQANSYFSRHEYQVISTDLSANIPIENCVFLIVESSSTISPSWELIQPKSGLEVTYELYMGKDNFACVDFLLTKSIKVH